MIVGTAGHIDHGKTLLVKALTGVDTDRLKEEKARGITIELGFAYVPVPGSATTERPAGDILGFVDVPGHERFVHTMLAGAASIDFALLVVAANDGVMAQTREHVQILDLLGITEGVVALNKIDLVDDERRLEVEGQIRGLLAGTSLKGIDILPVSATREIGIAELKSRLFEEAASRPERGARGIFRLAIDRSFTVRGAGTVVTGAVQSGTVRVGDKVRVLPAGQEVRVRTLHAQGRVSEVGRAGERCALNLAGIEKDTLKRGDWLVDPAWTAATARFDAELKLLASEQKAIGTWSPVHLHIGTARVAARIVILEGDKLPPGARALVQIVTDRPLPMVFGDRFVIRDVGAERTIGGGHVIDPRAPQRKRRAPERQAVLAALRLAEPAEALESLLALSPGIVDFTSFVADRGLTGPETEEVLELVAPEVSNVGITRFAARAEALTALGTAITQQLADFHAAHPDLPGMPIEKLRLRLEKQLAKPTLAAAVAMLMKRGTLSVVADAIRLPSHSSSVGAADQKLWDRLSRLIEESGHQPPLVREMALHLGQPTATTRKLCKTMLRIGALVEIAPDRFFLKSKLVELAEIVQELAKASPDKCFTAAEFRDRAGCGRAVAIQVLEYFDRRGFTGRRGDTRVVSKTTAKVFGDIVV